MGLVGPDGVPSSVGWAQRRRQGESPSPPRRAGARVPGGRVAGGLAGAELAGGLDDPDEDDEERGVQMVDFGGGEDGRQGGARDGQVGQPAQYGGDAGGGAPSPAYAGEGARGGALPKPRRHGGPADVPVQ